jgi:DNA helicase-2/ATP-dependent DNA helicase PcrA
MKDEKYHLPLNWSPQAEAVFEWVHEGDGSLILVARAGTGKTTVLLNVVNTIVEYGLGKLFLGCYNKAIAVEITKKLKDLGIDWKQAEASTMHALGLRLWKQTVPGIGDKIDQNKVEKIITAKHTTANGNILDPWLKANAATVKHMVSLAKQSGFGFLHALEDEGKWFELMDYHGINEWEEEADPGLAVSAAILALAQSIATNKESIDFDDMILAPLIGKVRVQYPYDWVLGDEWQDANATRRALALKVLKPKTGRFIGCGDDRQSIFGFTGADSDSMDIMRDQLGATTLPLTVTYRCPKAVVKEAQKYVPDIVAHESAPEGKVLRAGLQSDPKAKGASTIGYVITDPRPAPANDLLFPFHPTDAILCRNTAPLIDLAYSLIGRRIACRVEGRDIGVGLIKLAQRWKLTKLETLRTKLEDYMERERSKWLSKGREEKAGALEDKIMSLFKLIELCQSEGKHDLADLVALIDSIFSDSYYNANADKYSTGAGTPPKPMLTLSTVHKSKGKEWLRVFILDADKHMPSKYARKDWQVKQEQNLQYVAVTRAQEQLIYLSTGGEK